MIDRVLTFFLSLWNVQFLLWASVAVALAGGAVLGVLTLLRLRTQQSAEEEAPESFEDFAAGMQDRLDQCELVLRQFSQRAEKQQKTLQEAVTQLQSSMQALEKPFAAVASRFTEVAAGRKA